MSWIPSPPGLTTTDDLVAAIGKQPMPDPPRPRTAIVTGATSGLGLETARCLAQLGYEVFVGSRSAAKGQRVVDDIVRLTGNRQVHVLAIDLARLASVREAAAAFLKLGKPLHCLINNGGIASRGDDESAFNEDGFERVLATNYFGPYALTELLLPALRASAPSRIVNLASNVMGGGVRIKLDAFPPAKATFFAYPISKLCNIMHALALHRREAKNGVSVVAVHPGQVMTNIFNARQKSCLWATARCCVRCCNNRTVGQAASTQLYCAAWPDLGRGCADGAFYAAGKSLVLKGDAADVEKQEALYDVTRELLREHIGGAYAPPTAAAAAPAAAPASEEVAGESKTS